MKKDLWKTGFGSKYVELITQHTVKINKKQLSFIFKTLKLKKGSQLLDLGCGDGRYSVVLVKNGINVTGVDYSSELLNRANKYAKNEEVSVKFLKKDMRRIAFAKKFDAALSMYSFGFFNNTEDNKMVIKKLAQSLKKGGRLLLATNNGLHTLKGVFKNARVSKKTGNLISKNKILNNKVLSINELDPKSMFWWVTQKWKVKGKIVINKVSMHLYVPDQVVGLLEDSGFVVEGLYGNVQGSQFNAYSGLVIIAKKI